MGTRQSTPAAPPATTSTARASMHSARSRASQHTVRSRNDVNLDAGALSERERICSCFRGRGSGISNSHLCPQKQGSGSAESLSGKASSQGSRMYPNNSQIGMTDITTRTTTTSTVQSRSSSNSPITKRPDVTRTESDLDREGFSHDYGNGSSKSARVPFQREATATTTESVRSRRSNDLRSNHRSGEQRKERRERHSGERQSSDQRNRERRERHSGERQHRSNASGPTRQRSEVALMNAKLQRARTEQFHQSRNSEGYGPPPLHRAQTEDLDPRDIGRKKREAYRKGPAPPTFSQLKALVDGRKFTFNDFDLKATVGTGTFGRVRVVKIKGATDRSPFALKILKKIEIIRLKQVEHVKAEKQILEMIANPFIVGLLQTFHDEKRVFMLMEYVNGGELFSYLRREGRLPNDHARFYSGEVALAFQYLHSMNIVYRDLKPENLLIDCHGHMKITDFGFAKIVEDRTWTLCGTPEYLAPEIIQSRGHGKSVDWWALGILMFEMLAGYPPFYDENPFGIYQKVLAGKIDFPRVFDVKAKDLIKKLLTQDRTKRFGCLKNGAEDIKKHKWYKAVDWDQMYNKELAPPFLPSVKSADDTSMFDNYPESTEASCQPISKADQSHFTGF